MKTNILILAGLVVILGGVTYWMQTKPPQSKPVEDIKTVPVSTASEMNDALAKFTVTDLEGNTYSSTDFEGKPLVINLWASWCMPCVAEFPKLLSIARAYEHDMTLLLLSSDMDIDAINKFVAKLSLEDQAVLEQNNVIMVWDDMQAVTAKIFGVSRLPETFIVSKKGRIVSRLIGANWEDEEITDHLHSDR